MIPTVNRITKTGQESMDLLNYNFLEKRTIYLTEEIDDRVARDITAQLEYLDEQVQKDIYLYINSPGGSVTAGFAIADAIRLCRSDVVTVCTGMAASMGAFLLSCGTRGKRCATGLAESRLHQPLGGVQGQASDIQRAAEHILQVKHRINRILADNTGQPIEKIAADTDRDHYMTAAEAVEYGVIDRILETRP